MWTVPRKAGAALDELRRYVHELLAPIPRLQVWQWAEENIVLDERTSAVPGKFSTSLTPYIREPLQCYADKSITDLTLAETWDDEKAVDDNPIFREKYELAELPAERLTCMAIDFQDNHFWVIVRTYAPPSPEHPGGESWQLLAKQITTIAEVAAIQREYGIESHHVEWHQFSRENHLFDCECMCLVRAIQLGLVSMPDGTPAPIQGQFDLR